MNKKIITHFHNSDKILYSTLKKVGELNKLKPVGQEEYFVRLCREIVYQQLSDKAGDAIYGRFEQLFPNKEITHESVLEFPHVEIRNAGLSNAKVTYIKNLAEKISNNQLDFNNLHNMEDEEVIAELTKVKGIGRWTAEMFLMFSLAREDIFSHSDQGLKNAMVKLYNLPDEPTREEIEQISNKWSPYRTYACCILWKSLS